MDSIHGGAPFLVGLKKTSIPLEKVNGSTVLAKTHDGHMKAHDAHMKGHSEHMMGTWRGHMKHT